MYPDRARTPPMPARSYLAVEEPEHSFPRRLSIIGDLDLATASALAKRLDEFQAARIDVRLDLSMLQFIDSTGIRVLVTTAYHAREDAEWTFGVERTLDPIVRQTLKSANVENWILGEH